MQCLQNATRTGATGRCAVISRAQPARSVQKSVKKMDLSNVAKPVSTVVVTNLLMASPAFAEGKLFDFGLTLPIMAGQFLLLMVFLDKTWFTPVGKVLDERDELIRSKLSAVQGDSGKIAEMQAEAEALLKEARDAATAAVNEAKRTTQAEQDAKIQALTEQLDRDLANAMKELDQERQNANASIGEQVDALAEEIMGRVLPEDPMPADQSQPEPAV